MILTVVVIGTVEIKFLVIQAYKPRLSYFKAGWAPNSVVAGKEEPGNHFEMFHSWFPGFGLLVEPIELI